MKNSRMRALAFRIAIPFLIAAVCLEAQWQDRLYPFIELTDDMLAEIDLRDGSYPVYDPSSFDFRIWLAWHDASDQLFVGAEILDDLFVNVYDTYPDLRSIWPVDLSVGFHVDGDESGGSLGRFEETLDNLMLQAQNYIGFPIPHINGSHLILNGVSRQTEWTHLPPYSDSGGDLLASQPVHAFVEFYVTPFDRLIWEDPDQSLVSSLNAGKTIRFYLKMTDTDTDTEPLLGDRYHQLLGQLLGPGASYDDYPPAKLPPLFIDESGVWAQGILLGAMDPTRDTAVESAAWGRIKASLFE